MVNFTLYRTNGAGNAKNTIYPIEAEIADADVLCEALKHDHVCAKYKDDRRSEANFEWSDTIPMDCDNDHSEDPTKWKTPDDVKAAFPDVAFGVGYSRNHMKPKSGRNPRPKFHVYFPVSPITDAKQYAAVKQQILKQFPWFDSNAVDAARFYFGSNDNNAFIVGGKKTVDHVLTETITEGSRNTTLSRKAGRLIKRYGDTPESRDQFRQEAEKCVPPLDQDELQAIWNSALKYGAREATKPGYVRPEDYNATSDIMEFLRQAHPESNNRYTWTDIGASRLFADCFKDAVKYVSDKSVWYKYENGVWSEDTRNLFTMELCMELADELIRYALTIEDSHKKQDYIKYCNKWQSRHMRETILKDAQCENYIKIPEFDTDPYVFNCKNGTLHLDTMTFTKHSPADKLTKISDVVYDPTAKNDRFLKFIDEICSEDSDLAEFLQRSMGYGLSGDSRFECLFILYGAKTRNGKGTLCESVLNVLGSYGCTSRPETLGVKKNVNSQNATEDIARLVGIRFANISEPGKDLVLNAALVKTMTGNDTINARFLHENSFDFKPQFKLFINTNYLPTINDMTLFSSGRIVIIPFSRHFEENEQEKDLKQQFEKPECQSAILNWLIEGYQRVQKIGLIQPESVKKAIDEYKHDSNKFRQFVDEVMVEEPTAEIKTAVVYDKYRQWCQVNGCYPESSRNFNQELRGFAQIVKKRPRGSGNATTLLIGYTIDGSAMAL